MVAEVELRKLLVSTTRPEETRIAFRQNFVESATGFKPGDLLYVIYEPGKECESGAILITKEIKDIQVQ